MNSYPWKIQEGSRQELTAPLRGTITAQQSQAPALDHDRAVYVIVDEVTTLGSTTALEFWYTYKRSNWIGNLAGLVTSIGAEATARTGSFVNAKDVDEVVNFGGQAL